MCTFMPIASDQDYENERVRPFHPKIPRVIWRLGDIEQGASGFAYMRGEKVEEMKVE